MKTKWMALLLLVSTVAFAQPRDMERQLEQKRERIEAMKVAHLTTELKLTREESEKFWPVYNELQAKEMEIRQAQAEDLRSLRERIGDMSDKEIERALIKVSDEHIRLEQLRRDYLDDFIEVIGAKKTAEMMRAERDFGRKMMERARGDMPRGEMPPGGRPDAPMQPRR